MSKPSRQPSQCVLYFNRGTSCYIRLLVSIFSLRKHYFGPVKLMQEGELDQSIAAILEQLKVTVQLLPLTAEPVLVARASLWRVMEEDYALMLDADTIVCGPIDEFFGWIKERGFVASWFTVNTSSAPMLNTSLYAFGFRIEPAMTGATRLHTSVTSRPACRSGRTRHRRRSGSSAPGASHRRPRRW